MTDTELFDLKYSALKRLKSATLFLSNYRNGASKLHLEKSAKKNFISTRDVLCRQLKGLIELEENNAFRPDEEFISAAFLICDQYFRYMTFQLEQNFGDVFSEFENLDISKYPLFILADHSDEIIDEELIRLRGFDDKKARTNALIIRYQVGRNLYEKAAKVLAPKGSRGKGKIIRSIEFPPDEKQAGISILSYFGTIIDRRYPGTEVTVRIEQQGKSVVMIVETPSGEVETIERELDSYGKVVTGDQSVDDYSLDPMEALLIKNKLEMAQLELRQTKELMHTERSQYEKRIESLEENAAFMRSVFDKSQQDADRTREILGEVAVNAQGDIAQTFLELVDLLVGNEKLQQTELEEKLVVIHKEQPSLIDKLNELVIKGSIQGAAGNALYAAIMSMPKI